ncbi:MAG TPA: enoyl-CoA hydratase-related protein [Ilumatobacter sp.]|nr:enoyl-CoA hydratase-related protein [Ilumatobacter sp.]
MATSTALAVLTDHDDHGWRAALDDGVLHICLSRPPVNAINTSSWARLRNCMTAIVDDAAVRSVVLSSDHAKLFSAGQDFKDVGQDDGGAFGGPGDRRRVVRNALHAFYTVPVPTVVAVRGAAFGSGAVLPALADIVVGGPSSSFTLPEIDRGIVGGSRFLARLVPEPVMRKMILLGVTLPGEEMNRHGAFTEYVADDDVLETGLRLGRALADKHPVAMRLMKQANVEVESLGVIDGYEIEQKYSVLVPGSVRQGLIPSRGAT